jgi:hypothetical protein
VKETARDRLLLSLAWKQIERRHRYQQIGKDFIKPLSRLRFRKDPCSPEKPTPEAFKRRPPLRLRPLGGRGALHCDGR